MFKITELVLKDINNVEYPYKFSSGINFLEGKIVLVKRFSMNY